jgi:hypothetical protein
MLDPPGETLQVEYSYSEQKLRQQLQRKPTNGDAVVAARRQSRDASVLLVPSTSSSVVHDRNYEGSLLTHEEESGRHVVVDHHLQDDDWEGRSRAVPYPPPQPTRPVQLPTMHEPGVTTTRTTYATATATATTPESKIMIESSTLSIAAGDVFFVGSSLLRDDHDRCFLDDDEEMEFFHDGRQQQAPTPSSISSSLILPPPEAELPQQLPWQQQQHHTYDNTDMAVQSFEDHDDGNGVPMIFDDNNYQEEEDNGTWRHYEERQQRDAAAGGAVRRRPQREVVPRRQQQPARHSLEDGANNAGAVAWPFSQQQTQGSSGRGFADVNDDGAKKTGCGCCIS